MTDKNDEKEILLWNSFKNGDADSFVIIFKNYYSGLFNYGCKITRDASIVEDAIQNLFMDLWRSGGKAEIVSLRAYLYMAFKFKLLRAIKESGKANSLTTGENETSFDLSQELIIINREYNEELKLRFMNAIGELTARQSEIIYLKFYKGLSYEEVSQIMQISYQAARNLLYQSIKALKSV